jgi:hypothetical protein
VPRRGIFTGAGKSKRRGKSGRNERNAKWMKIENSQRKGNRNEKKTIGKTISGKTIF